MNDPATRQLLRAVLENPDCDTVRGVYADRLDEIGRDKQAAFIRRQLATGEAFQDMWNNCLGRANCWPRPFPLGGNVVSGKVRRGFVWQARVTTLDLFRHEAKTLFLWNPITQVVITTCEPEDRIPNLFYWGHANNGDNCDDSAASLIPARFFWLMRGAYSDNPDNCLRWRHYDTKDGALADLSDVLVAYGRHAAGLPPLPGGVKWEET